MNHFKLFAAALALLIAVPATSIQASTTDLELPKAATEMSAADWSAYSGHLVAAINSDHPGLRESALRYAILYQDSVDLRGATISMMKIYREADNVKLRRLAVVALGSLHSPLVDGYLTRAVGFEKDEGIKRTIKAVLAVS
ncbi:MAG: hypothetical protein HKN43_04380 [Rhodothermales bacterium]|nr:hypothetical protein [Rhodothermales bacterium]